MTTEILTLAELKQSLEEELQRSGVRLLRCHVGRRAEGLFLEATVESRGVVQTLNLDVPCSLRVVGYRSDAARLLGAKVVLGLEGTR